MVRQIQITIPVALRDPVLECLKAQEHVCALYDFPGPESLLIFFKMDDKHVSKVLQLLAQRFDIGGRVGCIDIVSLASTIPQLSHHQPENKVVKKKKKRKYAVTDRMTVEEIFDSIDSQSHLTFDYLAMVLFSAVIAAIGLKEDSVVTVVASMLVSPLMGPILCIIFGCVIHDAQMVKRGLRNELYGLAICALVGVVVSLIIAPVAIPHGIEAELAGFSASTEMNIRGSHTAMIPGLAIAFPSGCAIALGITGGGINALVGAAISAALLPPVVNAAMNLFLSIWYHSYGNLRQIGYIWVTEKDTDHQMFCNEHVNCSSIAGELHMEKAVWSFALFLMNFVVIFIGAFLTFKLKKVSKSSLAKRSRGNLNSIRVSSIDNESNSVVM